MKKLKISNLFLSLVLFLFAPIAFVIGRTTLPSPIAAGTLTEIICIGMNFLSTVLMPPIAVLLILWAGFLYLTAAGRPENIAKAHATIVAVSIGIVVLLLAPALVALTVQIAGSPSTSGGVTAVSSICSVQSAASNFSIALVNLINWIAWFIAAVSVAVGMYSGFLFMVSRGDPERRKKATTVMVFTVIGVAVSILAFSIIAIVEMFIG